MDTFQIPVKWPIYLFLCIISSWGLWISYRNQKNAAKRGFGPDLIDLVFVIPSTLTLIYGVLSMIRAILFWFNPGLSGVGLFEDPPADQILAAFCNGIVLAWVGCYIIFLYLRRRHV